MNVIECKDVTKNYKRKKALNSISFQIEENKITGLVGRNGAGKTTLLKIIAGYMKEDSGELQVFGESPFNNLMASANTIFIHDQMEFSPALNLKEIFEAAENFYEKWDRERSFRLLHYFSLDPKQYYKRLSKGMKSTFNMIFGLSANCTLTIFDEPTTGMDAAVRKDFYRALLKDYLDNPRTIILSSHHLNEIEDLIEDLLLIKDGKELLYMPIADLKEWAIAVIGKSNVVNEWIGNKEMIHSKDMVQDQVYVVVRNDFSKVELEKAYKAGIKFSPVSSTDLCVYLTSKTKGGIDDVFS
ncbi:MAG: ABC transporter ATP-binding protein [Bacillota bacterium]|nr:ABC transporter ATP-binding protein [Bacillota bacterium]